MIDATKLKTTTIIRLNQGMMRDCWWEEDKDEGDAQVFVLRQANLGGASPSGGQAKVKEFRLTRAEALAISEAILKGAKP